MCDFYYSPASALCMSVQMFAKALGVKLNLKKLNLPEQEHLKPEFLKLNPQHTIPTLVDNNFSLWESRAILIYLFEKYGKNDSFYPKDPKARAVINQRLYFDMGTLYQRLGGMKQGAPADPEKFKKLEEAVEFLDGFLSNSKYVAGEKPTLADYPLFTTFSTLTVAGFEYEKFKNVSRWFEECSSNLPGVEASTDGMQALRDAAAKHKA